MPTSRTPKSRRTPTHEPELTSESLDLLLRDAGRFPLLTPAEELELARQIERGDLAAKEKLVNSNLRLVVSIARRYVGHGLAMPDLVQEGMLGLIRAAEKFDHRKGFRFSTYATLWIRQSIQRGLDNTARNVRLPANIAQRARKVARINDQLTKKLEREPTLEEIAEEADLTLEEVERIKSVDVTPASLNAQVGDEDGSELGHFIANEGPAPEDEAFQAIAAAEVKHALNKLPEDERKVVSLRFGTDGDAPHTMAQVGRRLGIPSREAEAIEARALRRLSKEAALEALREAA
ncbi:MAG TPA: sigma-70 family RNA polymerase sigma factor [Solirubrobacteraceae bacterium]